MNTWLKHFQDLAVQSPGHLALVCGDQVFTHRDLVAEINSFAESLAHLPCPSRILIQHSDSMTVLLAVLGAWRAGLVPVVVRDDAPPRLVSDLLERIRPSAIFQDELIACDQPASPFPDEGLVLTTSGTTGVPKVVVLPHRTVELNARAIGDRLGLTESDRLLVSTSLAHSYGLIGGCLTGLWHGSMVHLYNASVPPSVLQAAIRQHDITVVQGPPAFFRLFELYWNGNLFESVRYVTTGGECIAPRLVDALEAMFPQAEIDLVFGMTEAGPRVSHRSLRDRQGPLRCIGKPFDHFHWQIVDGHLRLKSDALFLGYLQSDGSLSGYDDDGYFTSNDLIDESEDGNWFYKGRVDSVFKVGGKQVNPYSVEAVLLALPEIVDAYCRPESHDILGSVPVVDLVLKPGSDLDEGAMLAHCRARLDPASMPRSSRIVIAKEGIGGPLQKRNRQA